MRPQNRPRNRTNGSLVCGKEATSPRKIDRRVRHTRDVLGDALVILMHEKPFRAISVQDALERAHVSRSTFYTHFRDKDDLFLSDAEDFLEFMSTLLLRRGEVSTRIAPVQELFAHLAEWRPFHAALVASGKIHDFRELAQGHFARVIDQRLARLPSARALPASRRTAVAHAFAGALLSLVTWWIDHGMSAPPEQMDEIYHQMVWSGVRASAGRTLSPVSRSAIGRRI